MKETKEKNEGVSLIWIILILILAIIIIVTLVVMLFKKNNEVNTLKQEINQLKSTNSIIEKNTEVPIIK